MVIKFLLVAATLLPSALSEASFDYCFLYAPFSSKAIVELSNWEVMPDHPDTKMLCASESKIQFYDSIAEYELGIASTSLETLFVDVYESTKLFGTPAENAVIVPILAKDMRSNSSIVLTRLFMDLTGDMILGNERFQFSLDPNRKTR